MATRALLEGGPLDGTYVLVPAGAHAVWVETLSPAPWAFRKYDGTAEPLRVDEASRFVQYRRRANPGGGAVFHAPPEGQEWAERVQTPYFAKPEDGR